MILIQVYTEAGNMPVQFKGPILPSSRTSCMKQAQHLARVKIESSQVLSAAGMSLLLPSFNNFQFPQLISRLALGSAAAMSLSQGNIIFQCFLSPRSTSDLLIKAGRQAIAETYHPKKFKNPYSSETLLLRLRALPQFLKAAKMF